MGLFITETLSLRLKNTNLSGKFRNSTLRHLNTINLLGSGEQLVSAGSTSSAAVKSRQLQRCRHFFYRSEYGPETSSTLIRTVQFIEYSAGSPIGWHRDIPHFGVVVGISLGGACRMSFRKYTSARSKTLNRDEILSIELQPRSIYLMSRPSRESWQHSIPPVKGLRYSIMMRTLREAPGRW
jgi:2OG-Fe(II) oxygenase superfamily